jgi:hypothetical protein
MPELHAVDNRLSDLLRKRFGFLLGDVSTFNYFKER